MNKIQEAFEKKYLVSAFSQKEVNLKTFTAGYKAKEAETCEWTQDEIGWISYHQSECGHDIAPEDAPVGDYCPYCGGKIVEKENKG